MKPETESLTKKMINTIMKKKEQTKISKELHESITIALETIKFEVIEEEQLKSMLKEIAETTTRIPCNVINHPSTKRNVILNTPAIKIQQILLTKTIACREIELHDIIEVSTTFTIETYEIETPTKKYTIITRIEEVKPT
jgi:hypothetical protein